MNRALLLFCMLLAGCLSPFGNDGDTADDDDFADADDDDSTSEDDDDSTWDDDDSSSDDDDATSDDDDATSDDDDATGDDDDSGGETGGCDCASSVVGSGSASGLWLGLMLLAGVRRRR